MKNITFAIYNGIEYSAGIKDEDTIVLRSNNIKDLEYEFYEKTISKSQIYIKYVKRSDVQEVYDKKIIAIYQGYEFEVVEEKGDKISIVTMVGDYRDWLNLDMKCIDKGVYQKWINKDEAEIKIIKEEL